MTIPVNESGKRAFEAFYRAAEKLYAGAKEAIDLYTIQNYPGCRTLGEKHIKGRYEGETFIGGKCQRTVQTAEGMSCTIIYDYLTKEVAAV